jgi:hypothetical protein
MSKNIWSDLLAEEQGFVVPGELLLKRKELGLNNQEYILLLDCLYCYEQGRTEDLYKFLSESNGVSENTIQRRLDSIKKKGLLRHEVRTDGRGRIKGMILNPDPLLKKLESLDCNDESSGETGSVREPETGYEVQNEIKEKNWKDEFCSTRWYNDVFSEMYEEAAGQPVLTGGREYKSAETYFRRLRQLNPHLSDEGLFIRATEGARYILDSQLGGGVFGWLHKPPDICMLANQAQAVDYQLRCMERIYGQEDEFVDVDEECNVKILFRKKDKEKENGSKQIERVFGELREIEREYVRRDFQEGLRKGLSGKKTQESS